MNRILNCFSSAALALTLLAGCSSDSSSEGPVPPPAGEGNICGYVRCDGRGIAGVAVSDGANVVKTDAAGYYSFTSDLSSADFVRISVPSCYETARDGILPTFYAAIDPAEPGTQRFDFDLTAVDNTRHLLLVMADVHISGRKPGYPNDSGTVVAELDAKQCRERFVPALAAHAASAPAGYRVYGLNLGDMTHSEYWYSKNYSFPQYIEAMKDVDFPVFHAIGNHDYCHKVADDTADAQYKAALGPTYYSFNLGRIHYIVLDDMVYKGSNAYDTRIDDRQMEWLRKDLAATDPAVRDVVVAMHVPTVNGLQTDGSYKKALGNFRASFYDLFMALQATQTQLACGARGGYNRKGTFFVCRATDGGDYSGIFEEKNHDATGTETQAAAYGEHRQGDRWQGGRGRADSERHPVRRACADRGRTRRWKDDAGFRVRPFAGAGL